jgi:hypothetical protein
MVRGAPSLLVLVPLFYNGFWAFNCNEARKFWPMLLASAGRRVERALWLIMEAVVGPSTGSSGMQCILEECAPLSDSGERIKSSKDRWEGDARGG